MAISGAPDAPSAAVAAAAAGAPQVEHRATPAAAFARAREVFRSGQRLDMAQLASDLGVARATLYRWTGDRTRLLGDVCWAEVESLIVYVDRTAPGQGADRLERLAASFLEAIAGNSQLASFLSLEGDAGLRLVTALNGPVRPRIVSALATAIEAEAEAGTYEPPDDPELIADGIVALGERFLYHGGDRTLGPDPRTAQRIIHLLLREPSSAR